MDILSVLSWISKTVSPSLEVWEIFYIDRYTGGHNERISKFTSSSSYQLNAIDRVSFHPRRF